LKEHVQKVEENVKIKVVSIHALKAHKARRGIPQLILTVRARCSWMVNITSRPLYPGK